VTRFEDVRFLVETGDSKTKSAGTGVAHRNASDDSEFEFFNQDRQLSIALDAVPPGLSP